MRPSALRLMLFLGTAVCVAAQTNVNPTKTNQAKEATCVVSGIVIRKTDSAPLRGATVQWGNAEDREHTIATKTGADGHFELRNVPAGQYRLSAVRNGYFEYEYGQEKAGDPGGCEGCGFDFDSVEGCGQCEERVIGSVGGNTKKTGVWTVAFHGKSARFGKPQTEGWPGSSPAQRHIHKVHYSGLREERTKSRRLVTLGP